MRMADCHPDRPHKAKGFCLSCYEKAYYVADRERILARVKGWGVANREHIQAHRKAYDKANREHLLAYNKAYRKTTRPKVYTIYGSRCGDCLQDHADIWELHHVNGRADGRDVVGAALRKIIQVGHPLSAYALLCPNCHKRRHLAARLAAEQATLKT